MDRTPLKDAEEAWIAKYRSALKDIPVQQSRSTRFHEALNRAHNIIVSRVAGILAGSLEPSRWKRLKRSVQSSKTDARFATTNNSKREFGGVERQGSLTAAEGSAAPRGVEVQGLGQTIMPTIPERVEAPIFTITSRINAFTVLGLIFMR